MPDKDRLNEIKLRKERNQRLIELARDPYVRPADIRRVLSEGADVHARGSRAVLDACKRFNYDAVKALAEYGALSKEIARKYLGSVCDCRGFDKTNPEEFFSLIDFALKRTGRDDNYFQPYINNRAAAGDTEGLSGFKLRFGLSDDYVCSQIMPRIIFEVINNGHDDVLSYVSSHRDWIDQSCFDTAVAAGEETVLAYIIDHSDYCWPSPQSAATALFAGRTGVLDMLSDMGYDFEDKSPFFLEKACRATLTTGFKPLEYLLEHGYSLDGSYNGRTVLENALVDGNAALAGYVRGRRSEIG